MDEKAFKDRTGAFALAVISLVRVVSCNVATPLKIEANELVAVTVASIKTLRRRGSGS
jgi:hypothetical protein